MDNFVAKCHNITANMAWEDPYITRAVDDYCASDNFYQFVRSVIESWDALPLVENPLILSTPYPKNYYHWTFETAPKSRFFQDPAVTNALITKGNLQTLFQRNLIFHTLGKRGLIVPHHDVVRIRDPRVSHDVLSENNVRWLRDVTRFPVESGGRKVYLRRTSRGTRTALGGGISESIEFLSFLREYHFEIYDFGDREMEVNEQVMMLDKVGVILAPHGAALTNLAYLNGPLSVIEIIGAMTPGPVFLHLANMLEFEYYGLFSYDYDENQNIIVNMDELHTAMRQCLG